MKNSRKLLLIVAAVIFAIAGLVLIGNIAYPSLYGYFYPKSQMNLKSDAEIIAQFQARKTQLNQLLQKILQTEKELQPVKAERDKKNRMLNDELKKNDEINQNDPQLKQKERLRLGNELFQTRQSFMRISNEKYSTILEETNRLDFVFVSSLRDEINGDFKVEPKIDFVLRNNVYEFQKKHFWGSNSELYFIRKGLAAFTENNQPDQQLVVHSLDNYSSGNIKFITQKFIDKFGKNDTIYFHIEGNWYLFLRVIVNPNYDPNDLP